ncbi:beta-galactosidase [Solimicrobium silvestre]|uniref:Beta-galactosidase n=1 Tax=Solimicrobium silvestre TaxID=2099400 RepID=A0A2S9GXX9_9BURK|nr:beta-galactosidase [Solimicrobium silvestre]PRC92572.1 Glycosyl hydrolases family 35 [Solimicrobium silvestre]
MDRRLFLNMSGLSLLSTLSPLFPIVSYAEDTTVKGEFSFSEDGSQFLLNKAPFQIRSGEMHPARIPYQYWLHRIKMAKAMGMNTIAVYLIWNFHETSEGVFDFASASHDIAAFICLCQDEGVWVLLRPGPYVCGEWDLGGIPSYLLREPDIKLRANSTRAPQYMAAATRYIAKLAEQIKPLMINNGGPILMLQIENEFGSYGNDVAYLEELRQLWIQQGISGPFYTQDGLEQLQKNKTLVKGGALGLSGGELADINIVRKEYPSVPAMCGELYPGWLTHWGEPEFQGTNVDVSATLNDFMTHNISFNMYVIHGGTNFGFTAGANTEKGQYQPDITSYDYGAPITEQGMPTSAYFKYRKLIAEKLSVTLPILPAPIQTLKKNAAHQLTPKLFASIWDNLPAAIHTEQPQSFEALGQNNGFVIYRKQLIGHVSGHLHVPKLNDYGTVFLNDRYLGGFSRTLLPAAVAGKLNMAGRNQTLVMNSAHESPTLDVLVEAMGHINYGSELGDRKGILQAVSLQHPEQGIYEIVDWQTFLLPMDSKFIAGLKGGNPSSKKAGLFFKLNLKLDQLGDTFIDMQRWTKGVVWVNGHNLGRYWKIGPQHRLYCPAPWLKKGENEILIFDLHQLKAEPIALERTLG